VHLYFISVSASGGFGLTAEADSIVSIITEAAGRHAQVSRLRLRGCNLIVWNPQVRTLLKVYKTPVTASR